MNQRIVDQLRSDSRIQEARALLQEATRDHQAKIREPSPGLPGFRETYEQRLEAIARARGNPLFYPYLGSGIGRGPLVELGDGSIKYDFIGGIGVHVLGHSHPALQEAMLEASLSDIVMQGHLQQNEPVVRLMESLLALANSTGAALDHCFLSTSGAMANENALKILFHRKPTARRILAFEGAFAGRTLALSQITDRPDYRAGLPDTLPVDRVPFYDPNRPTESVREAVDTLRGHLERRGADYAGMIFELVLGEGGAIPGDRAFFTPLMELLRQYQIPVWVDEIQTFGRTSQCFAYQHFGLDPYVDVVTVGKMLQLSATLYRHPFNPKPGLLSQTFTAATASLYAAQALLDHWQESDDFGPDGRIMRYGRYFRSRLAEIGRRYPEWVHSVEGIGAMAAFVPHDGSPEAARRFARELFDQGVIAYVAGRSPTRLRFLIPYGAIDYDDLDAVARLVEQTTRKLDQGSATPDTIQAAEPR